MENVISVAATIAEYSVAPILRQFGYLIHYNSNIENLKSQVEKLKERRVEVQLLVDEEERNVKIIGPAVVSWLRSVDVINEELRRFLEDEVDGNRRCLYGRCPDLKSRHSLSRKAKKKTQDVVQLQESGHFNIIGYPAPPVGIPSTSMEGFSRFESRTSTMEEVMQALKDDKINMIGICGLGGIGKTKMVKEVGQRAQAEKLFNEVAMAVVSQEPKERVIQGEIAEMLGLKFDKETLPGRAEQLRARLMNGKKILIILDDVWAKLDFEKIGLPWGRDGKGCKFVLTSRSEDVCNEMRSKKNFTIPVLPEEEAWDIFREMAGNSVDNPDLYPIAREVANECGGLPLAIITVARALENKSKNWWITAREELKKSTPINISGMRKDVYSRIELSYNYLDSKEAQSCFLLCCLFPEDFDVPVESLVRYGMGLMLFEGIDTLLEARYSVRALVGKLRRSFLLLESDKEECVKMHDVVRDVAISIATKDENGFMVRCNAQMIEWPKKDSYERYTRISLECDEMHENPDGLDCPKLKLLRLSYNNRSQKSPGNPFERMKELRVLALQKMLFPSVPLSAEFLINLRTLCLENCELEDVSKIGELKKLEVLSFVGSLLRELPREIGDLGQLRLLDLTRCQNLHRISPGVLSRLSRLEELYIGDGFVNWEIEEEGRERTNASLAELKSLSGLVALNIHLTRPQLLAEDSPFLEDLARFDIYVGDYNQYINKGVYLLQNRMNLIHVNTSDILESGIKVLLKKVEILKLSWVYISSWHNRIIILHELDREGFQHLKDLSLHNCMFKYFINSYDWTAHIPFPTLESLSLSGNDDLEAIYHGPLPEMCMKDRLESTHLRTSSKHVTFLCNLRSLEVSRCESLESVFSQSTIIAERETMEEISLQDKREDKKAAYRIELPKLTHLSLEDLRSLVGFCEPTDEVKLPQLSSLELRWLPKFRGFCPKVYTAAPEGSDKVATQPSFNQKFGKKIECQQGQLRTGSVSESTTMPVSNFCKLFPSNWIKWSENLELLKMDDCGSLEVIFDLDKLCIEEGQAILPRLKEVDLRDLTKLTHIWKNGLHGIQGFQSLRSLVIVNCSSIRNLLSPSIAKLFMELQDLAVIDCQMIEEIVAEGPEEESGATDAILFPKLVGLRLDGLPNLVSFFCPGVCALHWPFLAFLHLNNCPKMKRTFPSLRQLKKINVAQHSTVKDVKSDTPVTHYLFDEEVKLSSIQALRVYNMNNLTNIWYGQLEAVSFYDLIFIKVHRCPNIVHVIPSSLLNRLQNLEKLEVSSCDSLQVVIQLEEPNVEVPDDSLCKLRWIEVEDCGKLLNVIPFKLLERFQHLEKVTVMDCALLVEVFESKGVSVEDRHATTSYQLEELTLESLPQRMHIWRNPKRVLSFEKLRCVEVNDCSNLRNLFSASMAQSLVQLQALKIHNCVMMREIIIVDEEEEVVAGTNKKIVFHCLYSLELKNLPNLATFCKELYALEWPLLGIVNIHDCPKLKTFSIGFLKAPKLEEACIDTGERHFLDDQNSQQLDFTKEVTLSRSERLLLSGVDNLMDVWLGEHQPAFVSKLRVMKLYDCINLLNVPSHFLQKLHDLEKLLLRSCRSVEVVFNLEGQNVRDQNAVVLPQLRKLKLWELPKLAHIWTNGALGIQSFQNLSKLHVFMCNGLSYLSSFSIAKFLVNLRKLHIESCEMIEEIVVKEEDDEGVEEKEKETRLAILFPQLSDLILVALPNLVRFGPHTCAFRWPLLKSLSVQFCPKIEAFAQVRMEKLYVGNMNNVTDVRYGQLEVESFYDLRFIRVDHCHNLVNVIPSSLLHRLQNLEELEVSYCASLEVIIQMKEPNVEVQDDSLCKLRWIEVKHCGKLLNVIPFKLLERFQHIKKVTVKDCASLVDVFESKEVSVEDRHATTFYQLEELTLESLPQLMHIGRNPKKVLNFPKLRCVEVNDCSNLRHLFSASMAQSLVQLHALKIHDCVMMEEIFIVEEKHEVAAGIMFPCLYSLELINLPNLTSFCKQFYALEWPSLGIVNIHKCPKMKTFSIGFLSAPKLEEAFIDTGERHFLADQNYQHGYFTKEVTLSRNEELLLGGVDNTEIWLGQRQPAFVSKLRVMKLQDCNNLLNVVPSDFLQKSHYLEQLQVWFCRSVEVVFDLQGLNVRGQNAVVLPQLRELQLWQLPKLAHIWTNGAPGIQGFQNLSRLHVSMCNRLSNLSSVSMAKILVNLRILQVEYCEMIEEVVVKEEDDEGVEEKEKATGLTILFPQLSDLILFALPNLVRFGPQTCTFTWPSLKSLSVKFCPKIETLAPVSLYAQKHNVKFNESHQEVGFQHWEKFEIWGTVNSEVGLGQIPDGFLCKIKIMDVRQCDNLLNVVPFYITERLRNLKILYVEKCASLVEVFETEGVNEEEGHTTAFSLLETIILISLPKLLHVWKNPKVALGFQNLRWLEVKDCGNLVHLILPSMAGNLVQLQTLKVVNCMMIEEIVAREEEETEEAKMSRIVLPQLHSLELKCLSNLKSFCGGIHAYELPLLACVNIDECPKMKSFSYGSVSTPTLKRISTRSCYCSLKGDLNTTIQHIFKGKEAEMDHIDPAQEQIDVVDKEE